MDVYAHMYMHICVTCVACVTLPEAYSSFGAEAGWRPANSRVRVVLQRVLSHSTIPPFLTASVAARIWDTPSAKRGVGSRHGLRTPLCVFGRARSESLPLVGGPVSIHDGFAHQFVANRAQKGAAGGRHLLLGCFAPQRLQLAQSHAPDAAQAGARGVPVSTLALRPLGTCSRRPIAHVQQLRGHLPRLLQQLRPPGSGAGGSIGGLHRRLIAASPPAALLCFWTAASDHPSSAPSACSCTSAPSGWRPRAASTARCLRAAPRPSSPPVPRS